MNFDQAINVHVQWKSKLAAYIAKPDHTVNAAALAMDNQCELGKWIHGSGQNLAGTPEFQKLAAEHARFHKAAGEVVRKADAGQRMIADVALGSKSEYATASNAVVSALMGMKKRGVAA